jgi:hypothetical protein
MPKYTLLDMVQSVLSDLNEDLVNSIDDTGTSDQVARIVKETYFHLHDSRIWPHTQKLMTLVSSADSNFPTHMKLPDSVALVNDVRYNTKDQITDADGLDNYTSITYITPEEMLDRMQQLNPSNAEVVTVTDAPDVESTAGIKYFIRNDKDPEYWTSFDDEWLVFDSYDVSFDDTLQSQKSLVLADVDPAWTHSDTFIPDLPAKAFSLLLEESKKAAAFKINQGLDPVANERARKQRTWLAGEKHRRADRSVSYPNYGR